jgi:hypothetical protein
MEFVKINFTPDRIKYILLEKIKNKVFEYNGVIFGGYVRDAIISDHYKSIYNNRNRCNMHNIHQFWNKTYQPDTAARAIVAKDMDICMYSEESMNTFIIALRKAFDDEMGLGNNMLSSKLTRNEGTRNEDGYNRIPIKIHNKLIFKVIVGRIPYVHSGVELSFEFDIIIPQNAKIQPPFYKTDMLSNVFIMNKQGIVMSNNTGTSIDQMSILNKQKMSMKIMADVVEFKTQFCMRSSDDFACGSYEYNKVAFERIHNLVVRKFQWEITNLPFSLENYKETNDKETCCICLSCINKNEKVIKIFTDNSTKTNKICSTHHATCLFKYFETQLETARTEWVANGEEFEFRCPIRNAVNFKKCSEKINKIIIEKMKT